MTEITSILALLVAALVVHALWLGSKLTNFLTSELTEEEKKDHNAYWSEGREPITYHSYMLETPTNGRDILAVRAWMKLGWKFYPEKIASVLLDSVCDDHECEPVSSGNVVGFLNPVYLVVNIGGVVCLDFVLVVASTEIPRITKMFNLALDQANAHLPQDQEYNMTMNVVESSEMRVYDHDTGAVRDDVEIAWNDMKENDEKYERAVDLYLDALVDNS